jgi:hypothetical protein
MQEIIPSVGDRGPQNLKDPGIRHMAIDVDNFDEGLAQLRGKNVNFITEPFENQGNRLVFFTDLDGNYLHLITRSKPLP